MSDGNVWRMARLGDHASIRARIGWKGLTASEYVDHGYPFLATPNIKGQRIDFDNVNFISERRFLESPELMLQPNDVLLVKDGSTLGISNLVRTLPSPSTINGSIAILRCAEILCPRYLHQLIKARTFQKLVQDKKSGLGVPHLFQADLREFEIPIPPPREQRWIAEILDSLDTTIHQTGAIIEKLKLVKQGLLHDLLTRGIDANGELRPPQSQAHHLYKDSPLGWIPREWDSGPINSRLAVLGGKRLPAGHAYAQRRTQYRYLRVTDFFEREYCVDDLENLEPRTFHVLKRYEIMPGQLYISIAGSIGHVGVHSIESGSEIRVVLTENAARLVPFTELCPKFVAAYLNSQMAQKQIDAEKGTGGGVPKLALFRIEQIMVAWPQQYEQALIVQRLESLNQQIATESGFAAGLLQLKTGLMDDLLTGRVRVTPLLHADPASA